MKLIMVARKIGTKEKYTRLIIGTVSVLVSIIFYMWYEFSETYFSKNINEWKIAISFICSVYGIRNIYSFFTGNIDEFKIQ